MTAPTNSIVPLTAQLLTETERRVGVPIQLEVQVTQNGTTGWLIALGAGVVLIGSTALRIRTVAKERAREARGRGDGRHRAAPVGLDLRPAGGRPAGSRSKPGRPPTGPGADALAGARPADRVDG